MIFHYGIYYGKDKIYHKIRRGQIVVHSFEELFDKFFEREGSKVDNQETCGKRARTVEEIKADCADRVKDKEKFTWCNNCEHWATRMRYGGSGWSTQVIILIIIC